MEEAVVEEPRLVTPDEEWDYAVETKNRDPLVPYIIHTDEFNENPSEHVQVTYTYYEMDDVLAGDRDEVIEDMDTQIGLGNLGHWGHGSGDPNIVYIRNEYMQIDAEVCRDPGSYVEQTRRNIRHSQNYRQRKPNRKFDDE